MDKTNITKLPLFTQIFIASILNYHNIDDPWDVDGNGIFKYAHSQVTNEALVVADDYCIVAGTDTNYPWTNQFELDEAQVPFWQETLDARFMVVCFVEPVFSMDYIEKLMVRRRRSTRSPAAAPTKSPNTTPIQAPNALPPTEPAMGPPTAGPPTTDEVPTAELPTAEEPTVSASTRLRNTALRHAALIGAAGAIVLA